MGAGELTLSSPQSYILTSPKAINLFLAGVGSGKTHLGGIVSGHYLHNFPRVRGFIGANTYNQLNTSTMLRIREVWRDLFGWQHDRDYVVGKAPPKDFNRDGHNFDRYDGILSMKNGAVAFIGSLDNAKAHDGKEFGWAILDETKDTREVDVKEVILTRMRQPGMYFDANGQLTKQLSDNPFNPLYILTSPAKVDWINEWFSLDESRADIEAILCSKTEFFKREKKDKCVAISSTYHNERNLPAGFIQRVLDNNPDERARALICASPFSRTGGEFYSGFSAARHIGQNKLNPDLPLHVSFDQNVVPYITATIWQVEQRGAEVWLNQIDEFCLQNPDNTSERLCDAITAKYGGVVKSMFYYGDASGHTRSTKGSETDYQIITRKLRRWLNNGSDRTNRANQSVLKRRDFINNMFEGKTRYRVLINEVCKKTTADYTYLKQDANGLKMKEKAKDEVSGQTFEKYGHTSDANDYFFCTVAQNDFERFCNQ